MKIKTLFTVILLTILPTTLLICLSIATYSKLRNVAINIPNSFVYSIVLILFFFLIILIIRFLFLLWFSFLDTLESPTLHTTIDTPFISILVAAYNEGKVIENSIKALLKIGYPNYEIIIINDGSTDDTFQKASAFQGRQGNVEIKVINKPNSGKAMSLNRGLEEARGELILSADADSKIEGSTLDKLIRHFQDPAVGAVAGNIKVINQNNLLTKLQALEYIEGINLSRRAQSYLRIVNIIPGPLGMFRKKVLKEVGGYSDDTFAEDCDMTLKILSKNYKIKFEPDSISQTEAPENIIDLFKQRYRWTRGIIQSISKHKKKIFLPFHNFSTSFTLWMMLFEALLPVLNIVANLFLIFLVIQYGFTTILFLWWCLLTVLDVTVAIYCISIENEDFTLVIYSVLYRVFYLFAIDFCRFFALIEEILGVKMTWGKLERKGRL